MAPRQLLNPHASLSHGSAAVSLSLLLVAAFGVGQALLIALIVGESDRTDAFFAAYSLYVVFALLGTTMRGSVVPLLGTTDDDGRLRERANDVLGWVAAIALALVAGLIALSVPLGQLLTLGLPSEARWTAVLTLLVLAPAALFQILAAGESAVFNAAHRFHFTAIAYVVAAAAGLAASAAALELIGVVGAAVGLLAGAVTLFASHYVYLHGFAVRMRFRGHRFGDPELRKTFLAVTSGAAVAITIQITMAIALGSLSSNPGAITAYSYAFFLVATMLVISSLSLGLVTMARLVSDVSRGGADTSREYLLKLAPYTFAVLAPVVALVVLFGKPPLEAVFASSLSSATVDLMFELIAILAVMTVPASFLYMCWALLQAQARPSPLMTAGAVAIAAQVALVLPLSTVSPQAVAGANVAAVTLMAGVLLSRTLGPGWLAVAGLSLARSMPAFGLAALLVLIRIPLGSDPGVGITVVAAIGAGAAYTLMVIMLWPSVSRSLLGLLRSTSQHGSRG